MATKSCTCFVLFVTADIFEDSPFKSLCDELTRTVARSAAAADTLLGRDILMMWRHAVIKDIGASADALKITSLLRGEQNVAGGEERLLESGLASIRSLGAEAVLKVSSAEEEIIQLLLDSSFPATLPLSNIDTASAAAAPLPVLKEMTARFMNTSIYTIASMVPSTFSTDICGLVLASVCRDETAAVLFNEAAEVLKEREFQSVESAAGEIMAAMEVKEESLLMKHESDKKMEALKHSLTGKAMQEDIALPGRLKARIDLAVKQLNTAEWKEALKSLDAHVAKLKSLSTRLGSTAIFRQQEETAAKAKAEEDKRRMREAVDAAMRKKHQEEAAAKERELAKQSADVAAARQLEQEAKAAVAAKVALRAARRQKRFQYSMLLLGSTLVVVVLWVLHGNKDPQLFVEVEKEQATSEVAVES